MKFLRTILWEQLWTASPELVTSTRNQRLNIKVTAKALRNKCSGKGFDVLWITFYILVEVARNSDQSWATDN